LHQVLPAFGCGFIKLLVGLALIEVGLGLFEPCVSLLEAGFGLADLLIEFGSFDVGE
jgi:dipeptide/tripeptide permease